MARTASLLALTLIALSGCTEPSAQRDRPIPPGVWPPPAGDASSGGDLADLGAEPDHGVAAEVDPGVGFLEDVFAEPGPVDVGLPKVDAGLPRGMGAPCEANVDCESGYCVDGPEGHVCTVTCIASCPPGWECKGVTNSGPDITFICLPEPQ